MKHFGRLLTVAITAAAVSLLDANAIGKVVAAKGAPNPSPTHRYMWT